MLLSVADFKVKFAVCELRYENAYLLFDRTGQVCHEARALYTDCNVLSAAPNQTFFQAKEGAFALELAQCRFSTFTPDGAMEKFAAHCKGFFDSVARNLDVRAFTRVGLRMFFRKDFKDLAEAKAVLTSLKLVNLPSVERFGAASEPVEIFLRWESTELGAMLRFKAESGKIDIVLPPELKESEVHTSYNGLVLDVDYYTVAPVERSQWDAGAWIPRSLRTIKKDIDAILGN
jgi:hypothetical protein